jgi:hypothetical protein
VIQAAANDSTQPPGSWCKAHPTPWHHKMEDQSLTPFVYHTLVNLLSIRLINLHPAAEATSELSCDITDIDLLDDISHHPPYTALSYAWGSNEKTCDLWCSSTRIPITASLDSALRAIRKPTWAFLVWVDAVCINQDDLQERNVQVANMVHIYSRASSVLVWLGDDDEQLNGARCLEWLEYAGRHHFIALQNEMTAVDKSLLEAFFSRDWFTRRWVIQEVAVAAHAFVICGAKRINWYDFIEGVAVLRVRHDAIGTNAYHEALGKLCTIEVLNKRFRERTDPTPSTHDGPSFLQIMLRFEASLCSDDRDRIFSLFHVASLQHTDLAALSSGLDYSLSTEEVYQKIAEVFLKSSDHYSLLHYAAAFRPEEASQSTLPSWIPDWRFRCRFRPLLHSSFMCGLDKTGDFIFCLDGTLRVRGFLYQYVGDGSHLVFSSRKQLTDIASATDAIMDEDYSEELNVLRVRSDPRLELFVEPDRKHGLERLSDIVNARRLLDATMKMHKGSPDEHLAETQMSVSGTTSTVDPATALAYLENSREHKTLRGRKLFATNRGLVGLGPSDVREGDAVVVLYGARTPFILRGNVTETEWRVVGDAYISRITVNVVINTNQAEREFHIV